MKGYTLVAGLMLATAPVMGQTPTVKASDEQPCISNSINFSRVNIPLLKKNFLWTLKSENDGVVESGLALITQVRILLPNEDMKDIESEVASLVRKGRTQVIRYKAYVAGQVFADPAEFGEIAAGSYMNYNDIFVALATRLQQTMLGYNGR